MKINTNKIFIYGAPILASTFFFIWFVAPIIWTGFISLYKYSPISPNNQFIGLSNYIEAFYEDSVFWKAVINSIYFTFGNVMLGTILALFIANTIANLEWFKDAAKLSFFMPTLFSIVAAAVVWKEIFQPRYGVLNNGLYFLTEFFSLPAFPEIGWTTTTKWSMPTVILFGLWKYLGIRIIILLAAIEAIPKMYYEAAKIDGVSKRSQFWKITVPLIKPALWFVIITGFINSLQVFEPMYIITEGGPVRSSISLVMLVNEKGFLHHRFGYAASISMVLFAGIMAITAVLFWVRKKESER
jgi:multiple sugar transport system permease protein